MNSKNGLPRLAGKVESNVIDGEVISSSRAWQIGPAKVIAIVILFLITSRVAVILLDYYRATWLFAKIYSGIQNTLVPDQITESVAIFLSGLALLLLPGYILRWALGPLMPWRMRTVGQTLRSRRGSSIMVIIVVWSAWVAFSYGMSSMSPGLFNGYTGAPRYKYYRDASGKIHPFSLGLQVHPDTGEPLKIFTVDVAREYLRQQQLQPPTPSTAQETKSVGKPFEEKPCRVFDGGYTDYALAKSGSGMRLWVRRAEFHLNKTVVSFLVEPGASAQPVERDSRLRIGEERIGSYSDTFVQYSKLISQPYEFVVHYGPVRQRGTLILSSNSFEAYTFPFEFKGCPEKPEHPANTAIAEKAEAMPAVVEQPPREAKGGIRLADELEVVLMDRRKGSYRYQVGDEIVSVVADLSPRVLGEPDLTVAVKNEDETVTYTTRYYGGNRPDWVRTIPVSHIPMKDRFWIPTDSIEFVPDERTRREIRREGSR